MLEHQAGRFTSPSLALFVGNRDEQTHLSGEMSNTQHSGQQAELTAPAVWLGGLEHRPVQQKIGV